jgi:hypothetical protein
MDSHEELAKNSLTERGETKIALKEVARFNKTYRSAIENGLMDELSEDDRDTLCFLLDDVLEFCRERLKD